MDSGYEAIIVDENIVTTNGINGNHEEATDMKTRSKIVGSAVNATEGGGDGDDESLKPKLRSTRLAVTQKSGAVVADDKAGSDSEKKDKKKSLRSGGDADDAPTGGAKVNSREVAIVITNSNISQSSSSSSGAGTGANAAVTTTAAATRKAKIGEEESKPSTTASTPVAVATRKAKAGEEESKPSATVMALTPGTAAAAARKKALDRDNDSGINSRASSVSNDDILSPARMRTRSSRASEIASTSTPAYKKSGGGARVPLSIYEFDAASFDDDLLQPIGGASAASRAANTSLKRKAVVYIEEMDDDDDDGDDDDQQEGGEVLNGAVEPAAKRRFLAVASAGIVSSLLYPFRKLRDGFAAIRPKSETSASTNCVSDENGDDLESSVADADHDAATAAAAAVAAAAIDEFMDADSQSVSEAVAQRSEQESQPTGGSANTCSLM